MNLTIQQLNELVELKKKYQQLADENKTMQQLARQLANDKCTLRLQFSFTNENKQKESNDVNQFAYEEFIIGTDWIRGLYNHINPTQHRKPQKIAQLNGQHLVSESYGLRIIAIIIEEKQNQLLEIKKQIEDIIISDISITVTELPNNPITDLYK